MGRYSDSCEQRFRQLYEDDFDRMEFNTSLMWRFFSPNSRKVIAIDAAISQRQERRLRISVSSGPDALQRYVVLKFSASALAWFSKANFTNEPCKMGFQLISRLWDDDSLRYSHDGTYYLS